MLASPAAAEWRFEAHAGSALSAPSPLTLRQAGQPELHLDAHWETRPWRDAPYYAYRLAWWRGRSGWELQQLHHKVYLSDPTPLVQQFEVTHGYNMVSLARAWRRRVWTARVGAGVVIAHPHSSVRGLTFSQQGGLFGGYFLTGPAVHAGIGARLGDVVTLLPEIRLTAARARVPIASGDAGVPNFALHLQLGVGLRLKR